MDQRAQLAPGHPHQTVGILKSRRSTDNLSSNCGESRKCRDNRNHPITDHSVARNRSACEIVGPIVKAIFMVDGKLESVGR